MQDARKEIIPRWMHEAAIQAGANDALFGYGLAVNPRPELSPQGQADAYEWYVSPTAVAESEDSLSTRMDQLC